MKYWLVIFFLLLLQATGGSQNKSYPFYQLYQLDSIGQSNSIGRHFGSLYFDFLQSVEKELETADTTTQRFLRHFEMVFAQFYIDACAAYQRHEQIPLPAWRVYFVDSTLQFYQYYLLGANAHLNGGLAEAIAGSYTHTEWVLLKKRYYLFNKCLNKTLKKVYAETVANSKRARRRSILMLGLDKPLNKYFLYRWRKRQMRLTEYFYTGSPAYKKLFNKVNKEKEKIDHLILTKF